MDSKKVESRCEAWAADEWNSTLQERGHLNDSYNYSDMSSLSRQTSTRILSQHWTRAASTTATAADATTSTPILPTAKQRLKDEQYNKMLETINERRAARYTSKLR